MTDTPRAVAIRWFEEWWNNRSETIIEEITTPDCVAVNEGVDGELDRQGMREHRRAWLSAVPDVRMELLSVTSDDATVVVHWRARGTHTGHGIGIPPSGRAVDVSGFTSLSFDGGLIARGVDRWNRGELIASLMQVRLDELVSRTSLTAREAQVALMMGTGVICRRAAAATDSRRHVPHTLHP